ncbi:MAG: hypothetical protein AABW99_01815 [archaeon]
MAKVNPVLILVVIAVLLAGVYFFVLQKPSLGNEFGSFSESWISRGISIRTPHEQFQELLKYDVEQLSAARGKISDFSSKTSSPEMKVVAQYYLALFDSALSAKELSDLSDQVSNSNDSACNLLPKYSQISSLSQELGQNAEYVELIANQLRSSYPEVAAELNINTTGADFGEIKNRLQLQSDSFDSIKGFCGAMQ